MRKVNFLPPSRCQSATKEVLWGQHFHVFFPRLTHLDPQDRKNGKATKHHKLRYICRVGDWGRSSSLLRRENCRTAMPPPRGLGAPGRILELTLIVRSAGLLDPRCHRRVGLEAIEWGPAASEMYSLCFFDHVHGIVGLRFVSWSKWRRLVPKSSCEGFFLTNCCQFRLSTSCKSASV